jgi:hypothetical protein
MAVGRRKVFVGMLAAEFQARRYVEAFVSVWKGYEGEEFSLTSTAGQLTFPGF